MNLRKIIKEEMDSFGWIKDANCPVKRGDMFHVQYRFKGPQVVIGEVSDDCEWVRRFSVEEWGSLKRGRMDMWLKKKFRDWESKPFDGSNAIKMSQVLKNIESGFWVKVDEEGNELPFEYIKESKDFDWIKQTEPPKKVEGDGFSIVNDFFKTPHEYRGWDVFMDSMTGTISWEHPELVESNYYATPYWDGASNVPIDFNSFDGEGVYEHVGVVGIPKFEYEWELLDWLESEYFESVYEEISIHTMRNFGPLPE